MNTLIKENDNKVLKILGDEKFITSEEATEQTTGDLLN